MVTSVARPTNPVGLACTPKTPSLLSSFTKYNEGRPFLLQDVRRGDVMAWPTNVGWMMDLWLFFGLFGILKLQKLK